MSDRADDVGRPGATTIDALASADDVATCCNHSTRKEARVLAGSTALPVDTSKTTGLIFFKSFSPPASSIALPNAQADGIKYRDR